MKRLIAAVIVSVLAACQTANAPKPAVKAVQTERPRQVSNRDDILQSLIERRIRALDSQAYRAVHVLVWGNRVMLAGAVVKPEHKRKAEQIAAGLDGVIQVWNELVLVEDSLLGNYALDFAKEEELRLHLGIDGKSGTAVRVANGVGFILGGVENDEQAEALKADATDLDGIKWAVAHLVTGNP